jgi:hypothetical protein
MHKKRSCVEDSLSTTVQRCLTNLQAVSLSVETYGNESDASTLRQVIDQLRSACPIQGPICDAPLDFVVCGTFKVTRQQAANALWHAFTGELPWFRIIETVPPPKLRFRSIDQTNPGIVDYPLNEGGAVRMETTEQVAQKLELRLDIIAQGLEVLATYYPRHFADLVNDNADSITADALLQCCLFGEIIYG